MARRKKVTLGEMIRTGGWLNTRTALRYASRFGMACEGLGRVPTAEDYAEFHGLSRAQAFRDQKAWRLCVPGYSVLEVVSSDALSARGLSEADREEAIASELADG